MTDIPVPTLDQITGRTVMEKMRELSKETIRFENAVNERIDEIELIRSGDFVVDNDKTTYAKYLTGTKTNEELIIKISIPGGNYAPDRFIHVPKGQYKTYCLDVFSYLEFSNSAKLLYSYYAKIEDVLNNNEIKYIQFRKYNFTTSTMDDTTQTNQIQYIVYHKVQE